MVVHSCNPSSQEVKQKDSKFMSILTYLVIAGLAWDTWNPISKEKREEKEERQGGERRRGERRGEEERVEEG